MVLFNMFRVTVLWNSSLQCPARTSNEGPLISKQFIASSGSVKDLEGCFAFPTEVRCQGKWNARCPRIFGVLFQWYETLEIFEASENIAFVFLVWYRRFCFADQNAYSPGKIARKFYVWLCKLESCNSKDEHGGLRFSVTQSPPNSPKNISSETSQPLRFLPLSMKNCRSEQLVKPMSLLRQPRELKIHCYWLWGGAWVLGFVVFWVKRCCGSPHSGHLAYLFDFSYNAVHICLQIFCDEHANMSSFLRSDIGNCCSIPWKCNHSLACICHSLP